MQRKVEIDSKECIKVEFQGEETPYFAFGRAFIRVGDEDRQLSAKELENMFLRKNRKRFSWENMISCRSLKEINEKTLSDLRIKIYANWKEFIKNRPSTRTK